jgi:hypothetical protein
MTTAEAKAVELFEQRVGRLIHNGATRPLAIKYHVLRLELPENDPEALCRALGLPSGYFAGDFY